MSTFKYYKDSSWHSVLGYKADTVPIGTTFDYSGTTVPDGYEQVPNDDIYPVGSIYMNINEVSPASLFGGTWERISQGRFLIGAGSPTANTDDTTFGELNNPGYLFYSGDQGGQYKHTLTTDEMPSHTHLFRAVRDAAGTDSLGQLPKASNSQGNNYGWGDFISDVGNNAVQYTGESQSHNNMPPYLVVYMWKRIA